MLTKEHIDFLPESGTFAVQGERDPVGHRHAVAAIHAGSEVKPGTKHVARLIIERAGDCAISRHLARIYGVDVPQWSVPVGPAPEDASKLLRTQLDAAGKDVGMLNALSAQYGVELSKSATTAATIRKEIEAAVTTRIAVGKNAKV